MRSLLRDDAVAALVGLIFPLATVVTPNLIEARALTGSPAGVGRRELAEQLVELGAAAAVVTGGHGEDAVDHLFDGRTHVEIPVERIDSGATHGAGCTHSATLAAGLGERAVARRRSPRRGRGRCRRPFATGCPRSARATVLSMSST